MATRRVTSTDGVGLAVHESGNPDGPVVVAVHGFPDSHVVWDGVARELGDQFRFIAYDVRGAGESDRPGSVAAYRVARLGDDLEAVLDAVSPGGAVHLLGHDWGSIQMWELLAEQRFAGRVATFTSISGPSLDHAGVWLRARGHRRSALRQVVASTYMAAFQLPWLPELLMRRGAVDGLIGGDLPRSSTDRTAGINLYRANVLRRVLRPRPPRLDLPVHVIAPVDDPHSRRETATGAPVPFVRDLTVEEIPGGHWVVAEDPALVAARVRAFLERHLAPSAGRPGRP